MLKLGFVFALIVSVFAQSSTADDKGVCLNEKSQSKIFSQFLENGTKLYNWHSILASFKRDGEYIMLQQPMNVADTVGQCIYLIELLDRDNFDNRFTAVIQKDNIKKKLYLLTLKSATDGSSGSLTTAMNNGKPLYQE